MVQQYGFSFDADRCSACKACMIACKDKNNAPLGAKYRKVIDVEHGTWEEAEGVLTPQNVYLYSVSIACNHCAQPACVENCPQGAMIKRDDGIVYVDTEACIGCGTCAESCPYDAPRINEETKVSGKCDLCRDLLDAGENPACVDACLMRCLQVGDIEELRNGNESNTDIPPLPSSDTEPSLVIALSRHSNKADEVHVINPLEEIA